MKLVRRTILVRDNFVWVIDMIEKSISHCDDRFCLVQTFLHDGTLDTTLPFEGRYQSDDYDESFTLDNYHERIKDHLDAEENMKVVLEWQA